MQPLHDTIAALATPPGIGGIAVIRISGERAIPAADGLFRGSLRLADVAGYSIAYGLVADPVSRETVDTVLASVFRNPHSYTGEDVVEINCHGGYTVASRILSLLYRDGTRPAEPGEFTLRAFLNGKLDLVQAEAVADLIHSRSERAHQASVDQLSGKLSGVIAHLRSEVLNICSLIELELDFAQEGIELAERNELLRRISVIEERIAELIGSFRRGKVVREGVTVVLAGKPNAGKSSLLNVLLEEERAIVSSIPGTTRDTIEESIIIHGVEVVLKDTAGLRTSTDSIEQEGIRRSMEAIASADLVVMVIDATDSLSEEDLNSFADVLREKGEGKMLWVLNKCDRALPKDLPELLRQPLFVSCKTHEGLPQLKERIFSAAVREQDSLDTAAMVTNIRHKDALDRALASLNAARHGVDSGVSGDFIAMDLRGALDHLGEIIGITTPDDILNNIFASFCIGK